MDAFSKFAFRIFGPRLEMEKYYSLERSLRQARIPVSWDVYVAKAKLFHWSWVSLGLSSV